MKSTVLRCALVALASVIPLIVSAPAQAGLFRAYLAVNGSDTNPCTLALPCRLLPAGLAAANDGGEIWMLDSANYNTGPVNIDRSITILAVPGVLGSVVAAGGNAISIATGGVKVTLRNLNILPLPGSNTFAGISMTNGAKLTIQNCNVLDFANSWGLNVATAAQVSVIDSVFRGNATAASFDAGATARISGSHFSNGGWGVYVGGSVANLTTSVTVSTSIAANNGYGFHAHTSAATAVTRLFVTDSLMESNSNRGAGAFVTVAGGVSETSVSDCLVVGNESGLKAEGAGAKLIASGNTVTHNIWGLYQFASGVLESAGNNTVRANNIDVLGGPITTFARN